MCTYDFTSGLFLFCVVMYHFLVEIDTEKEKNEGVYFLPTMARIWS